MSTTKAQHSLPAKLKMKAVTSLCALVAIVLATTSSAAPWNNGPKKMPPKRLPGNEVREMCATDPSFNCVYVQSPGTQFSYVLKTGEYKYPSALTTKGDSELQTESDVKSSRRSCSTK